MRQHGERGGAQRGVRAAVCGRVCCEKSWSRNQEELHSHIPTMYVPSNHPCRFVEIESESVIRLLSVRSYSRDAHQLIPQLLPPIPISAPDYFSYTS